MLAVLSRTCNSIDLLREDHLKRLQDPLSSDIFCTLLYKVESLRRIKSN